MSTALKPEFKSTTIDVALFEAWNAVQLLMLLNTPALAKFGGWIDSELGSLEAAWVHAAPPQVAKKSHSRTGSSRIAGRKLGNQGSSQD